MRVENDSVIFESRAEAELLQNICEAFLDISKSAGEDEERQLARELSAIAEAMWRSW